MDSGIRLLQHARRLIERGWTQHADARDAGDVPVQPWDDRAVSWSLLGALVAAVDHAADIHGENTAIRELALTCVLLADNLDTDSLEEWNDSPARTQQNVLAALDGAATHTDALDGDQNGSSPS